MSAKGIIDPWAPPKKVVERAPRIDLEQIDMDADLRVAQSYVFRSLHGSINVTSPQIGIPEDALRDLAGCLLKLSATGPRWGATLIAARIGVQLENRTFNMRLDVPYSVLRTSPGYKPHAQVCFLQQEKDRGMLQLVKLLCNVRRTPAQVVLQEFGVVPMMR